MATDTTYNELERIRAANSGVLRPCDVLEAAEDSGNPLHGYFEWNDGQAAHEYRLEQARRLIRCTVRVIAQDKPPVRAYVSLRQDRYEGDSYRHIVQVMTDADLNERFLGQALREADSWRSRYERFVELAPIVQAIKEVAKKRRTRKKRKAG